MNNWHYYKDQDEYTLVNAAAPTEADARERAAAIFGVPISRVHWLPPIAEEAEMARGITYHFYDPEKPAPEEEARRWEIMRRFYDSYMRGENRQTCINALVELVEKVDDLNEIIHRLALYTVGEETPLADVGTM